MDEPHLRSNATEAQAERRRVYDNLRSSDIADVLDGMLGHPDRHRKSVAALTTWHRWATGHSVRPDELRDAVRLLAKSQDPLARQLAESAQPWATKDGIGAGEWARVQSASPTLAHSYER